MDIVIQREPFAAALEQAAKVADKKATMPILANVLLRAERRLLIAASDLATTVISEIECDTKSPGAITLPAKQLAEAVKSMTAEMVTVSVADLVATVKGGKTKFTLPGMLATEFPNLPLDVKGKETVVGQALHSGISLALPFSSVDETRYHLNAVFVDAKGLVVATDGHRILAATRPHGLKADALIRRASAPVLAAWLAGKDSVGVHRANNGELVFIAGPQRIAIKLLDATFPPYEHIIPKTFEREAIVPREAFIAAVERVLIANETAYGLRLSFTKGEVQIDAKSNTSQGQDVLACDFSGEQFEIGANGQYVLSALNSIEGDEVKVKLGGQLDPILFTPVTGEDVLAIVMPVRL